MADLWSRRMSQRCRHADPVHDARKVGEIFVVEGFGEGLPQELVVAVPGFSGK